jgi:hypothetical protein
VAGEIPYPRQIAALNICGQFGLVFSNNCLEKLSRFKSAAPLRPASIRARKNTRRDLSEYWSNSSPTISTQVFQAVYACAKAASRVTVVKSITLKISNQVGQLGNCEGLVSLCGG